MRTDKGSRPGGTVRAAIGDLGWSILPAGRLRSGLPLADGSGDLTSWLTLSVVCLACFFAGLSWAALNVAVPVYITSFSVAELFGPSAGGLVADSLGWRWIFWLNVPVGIAWYWWGRRVLPRKGRVRGERLDMPGLIMVPLALASLIFALAQSELWGWSSPAAIAGIIAAVAVCVLFLVVERRITDPLVQLRMFASKAFTLAMTSAFVNAMAQFSVVLLIALFFQAAHGNSAFAAGLKVTPLSAVNGLLALAAGLLTRLGRPRGIAVDASPVLAVIGTVTAVASWIYGRREPVSRPAGTRAATMASGRA